MTSIVDRREMLADFLDTVGWDYFCTFTTRKPISLKSARKIATRVHSFLPDSDFFWAAEPFETREGFHFHALMNTRMHPMEIFQWYQPRYGRCQIIHNIDPVTRKNASYYLTKYIVKGIADYDLYFSDSLKKRNQIQILNERWH